MKSKLIMAGLAAVLAISLLGCAPTAVKETSVTVSLDDFMNQNHISRQVEVPVGGLLTVTLGSNPTTGFDWQPAVIADVSVLEQEGNPKFIPPEKGLPGAGGQEVWTFRALKTGTTDVSMEYSRMWTGGEKGAWTFNLTVTVP